MLRWFIRSVLWLLGYRPPAPPTPDERAHVRALIAERAEEIQAMIARYAELSRAVGPCDRAAAENAVTECYRAAGFAAPHFIWFDSPLPACRTIILWNLMEAMMCMGMPNRQNRLLFSMDAIRDGMDRENEYTTTESILRAMTSESRYSDDPIRDAIEVFVPEIETIAIRHYQLLFADVRRQIALDINQLHPLNSWFDSWYAIANRLQESDEALSRKWQSFADIFWALSDDEQRNLLERAYELEAPSQWWNQDPIMSGISTQFGMNLGSGDADRAVCYELHRLIYHCEDKLEPFRETVRHCGWWHPEEGLCFMVDRPIVVELDEFNRLHGRIEYADGTVIHAIHGVRVSEKIAAGDFTAQDIDIMDNVEVRRVMIDKYGAERYLLESGAEKVHEDQYGILYRKSQRWDEPLVMVKVKNSTPEPDGNYKDYFLRVPPNMRTAREAVAWTFDVDPKKYKPQIET